MNRRVARFVAFVRKNWADASEQDKQFTQAALLALMEDTVAAGGKIELQENLLPEPVE